MLVVLRKLRPVSSSSVGCRKVVSSSLRSLVVSAGLSLGVVERIWENSSMRAASSAVQSSPKITRFILSNPALSEGPVH